MAPKSKMAPTLSTSANVWHDWPSGQGNPLDVESAVPRPGKFTKRWIGRDPCRASDYQPFGAAEWLMKSNLVRIYGQTIWRTRKSANVNHSATPLLNGSCAIRSQNQPFGENPQLHGPTPLGETFYAIRRQDFKPYVFTTLLAPTIRQVASTIRQKRKVSQKVWTGRQTIAIFVQNDSCAMILQALCSDITGPVQWYGRPYAMILQALCCDIAGPVQWYCGPRAVILQALCSDLAGPVQL